MDFILAMNRPTIKVVSQSASHTPSQVTSKYNSSHTITNTPHLARFIQQEEQDCDSPLLCYKVFIWTKFSYYFNLPLYHESSRNSQTLLLVNHI